MSKYLFQTTSREGGISHSLLRHSSSKHSFIFSPTACATGGGNAFPIIRHAAVFFFPNVHVSGKPCILAIILLVRRGIPSKSGSGAVLATPRPSTPSSAHAFLALTGPRSGPPCFLEPPTKVGAILFAFFAQSFAPSHLFSAIKSYSVSPTVGAHPGFPFGYEKEMFSSFRIATITTRGRSCGTAKSEAFNNLICASYPSISIDLRICFRYSSKPASKKPLTFSSITALGSISLINRIASGNKSRSSSFPNCLPAIEKGGQGTPPANKSTPR